MKTSARTLLASALLFSLAGCGLKGPLYLPDEQPREVPASAPPAKAVLEGSKVRTLPPAPQSQKKDREGANSPAAPSPAQPTPASQPDPPDPDGSATAPTPPGQ